MYSRLLERDCVKFRFEGVLNKSEASLLKDDFKRNGNHINGTIVLDFARLKRILDYNAAGELIECLYLLKKRGAPFAITGINSDIKRVLSMIGVNSLFGISSDVEDSQNGGSMSSLLHMPVMESEVTKYLIKDTGGVYIDCTLGGGGHAAAILKVLSPGGRLIGIDRDKDAIDIARRRFCGKDNRIDILRDNYTNLRSLLNGLKIKGVDGILLDAGLSSIQIEKQGRGFSFQRDEPLDMRMDRTYGKTAADLVNELKESEIKGILIEYGEERFAGRISREICKKRRFSRISTTMELAEIVSSAVPVRNWPKKIHPATRTFQALRIAVNDELNNIEKVIFEGVQALKPLGRFCIITFHSLEDRIVKNTFALLQKGCTCPVDMPVCACGKKPLLKVITKKPLKTSDKEVMLNPKARSAKLRVAERLVKDVTHSC